MARLRLFVQAFVAAGWCMSVVLAAITFGIDRAELAEEVSAAAMASPELRSDISQRVADAVLGEAPLLGEVPGARGVIVAAAEQPALDPIVAQLVANEVNLRLGRGARPLEIDPGRVIETENAFVAAGLSLVPAVTIPLQGGTIDPVAGLIRRGAPIVFVATAALHLLGARLSGRPRTAMAGSIGAAVAAFVLIVASTVAEGVGSLDGLVIAATLTSQAGVVVLVLALLIAGRAALAASGRVPYVPWERLTAGDHDSMDFDGD